MSRIGRAPRAATALILAAALAGCSGSPSATRAQGPASSSATNASAETTVLPDLVLARVQTETRAARAATVGPEGGSVTATADDGTAYSLSIPAGALDAPTSVALYPVASLTGLPSGTSLRAGVQFAPEGLRLVMPARLTITLPSGDAATVGAVGWDGDADRLHDALAVGTGHSVTMSVFHFSGVGLTPEDVALALACNGIADPYGCEIDAFLETFALDARKPNPRSALLGDLRFAYANIVKPSLDQVTSYMADIVSGGGSPDSTREDAQAYPYLVWLDMVDVARTVLNDPTFTVPPEVDQAKTAAVHFLRFWFDAENDQCKTLQDDVNVRLPLHWAFTAIGRAQSYGRSWGVDSAANKLDDDRLLADLCVHVVLDPDPSYAASRPGDSGTVTVTAGFSIEGGPTRFGPNPVRVTVQQRGASTTLADQDTDSQGGLSVPDVAWPAGVDPIHIDVTAVLTEDVAGSEVLTAIRAFRGITRGTVSEIAFVSSVPGSSRIETIDTAGGPAVEVTSGSLDIAPSWSPDGSRIAFSRTRSGIFSVAPDGTDLEEILSDPNATAPAWSPDGSQIAFLRAFPGTNGSLQLALMNADGSNVRDTAITVVSSHPSWSPDGKRIAYAAMDPIASTRQVLGKPVFYRPYRIFLYDVGTGGTTKLLTHDCEPWGAANPAWSPDGSRISIMCETEGPHPSQIGTISTSGGAFSLLWTAPNDCGGYSAWSPDGKRLVATGACGATGLVILEVGGGASRTIGSGTDAVASQPAWSP